MECNAIRQAVCANEMVYDSVVEVPLENDVILPDYCPDIVKVLKCTVNACVSSTQVQGRQMTLEGMCTVHLLYLGRFLFAAAQHRHPNAVQQNGRFKGRSPAAAGAGTDGFLLL